MISATPLLTALRGMPSLPAESSDWTSTRPPIGLDFMRTERAIRAGTRSKHSCIIEAPVTAK